MSNPELPPIDRLTEIDLEVKAMVSEALRRWGQGEDLADIAKDPAIRSTLDFLNSVPLMGSDLADVTPEMQAEIDREEARHQERLLFADSQEQDDMALFMLKGLVELSVSDKLEGEE